MYRRSFSLSTMAAALAAFPSAGAIGQFVPLTPTVALDGYIMPPGALVKRKHQDRSRYVPHQNTRERTRRRVAANMEGNQL